MGVTGVQRSKFNKFVRGLKIRLSDICRSQPHHSHSYYDIGREFIDDISSGFINVRFQKVMKYNHPVSQHCSVVGGFPVAVEYGEIIFDL